MSRLKLLLFGCIVAGAAVIAVILLVRHYSLTPVEPTPAIAPDESAYLVHQPASGDVSEPADAEAEPAAVGDGVVWGVAFLVSGKPAVDAALILTACESGPRPRVTQFWHAHADTHGQYAFRDLPCGGHVSHYALIARFESLVAIASCFLSPSISVSRRDLILMEGLTLAGEVVNSAGTAVDGATLVPVMRDEFEIGTSIRAMLTLTTEGSGQFQWDILPPLRWTIAASAPGYAPRLTEPFAVGRNDATIVLLPGETITGHAVHADSGEAVPNLTVVASTVGRAAEPVSTRTADDGSFSFANVMHSEYTLDVDDLVWALIDGPVSAIPSAEDAKAPVLLRIVKGGTIAGAVTTSRTGAGVEGIALRAVAGRGLPTRRAECLSESGGTYAITGLSPGVYRVIMTCSSDYVTAGDSEIVVHVADGTIVEGVDFSVEQDGMIVGGVVVDDDGNAIADADVRSEGSDPETGLRAVSTRTGTDGRFLMHGFRRTDEIWIRAETATGSSDMLGPFTTGLMNTDGPHVAMVGAPENVVLSEAEFRNMRLVVTSRTLGLIAGTVLDSRGIPMRARVSAFSILGDAATESVSTRSDGEGRFAMRVETPAEYDMMVARLDTDGRSGPPQLAANVSLRKGQSRSDIRLRYISRGSSIRGRVCDSEGTALAGVWIKAKAGNEIKTAFSSAAGDYEITELAEGLYTVEAQRRGGRAEVREAIPAGQSGVDFVLASAPRISGQVVHALNRRPITSFDVASLSRVGGRSPFAPADYERFADPSGRFSIVLSQGHTALSIRARGYLAAEIDLANVDEDVELGAVPLSPGEVVIDGIVRNAAGAPVAGAAVWASQGSPVARLWPRDPTVTGDDGAFHLNAVPVDAVEVVASHPDYAFAVTAVQARLDEPQYAEIVFNAAGEIEGTVHESGTPVSGVMLFLSPGLAEPTTSDAEGHYHFTRLPAGLVDVRAQYYLPDASGTPPRILEQEVDVIPGEIATLDFHLTP